MISDTLLQDCGIKADLDSITAVSVDADLAPAMIRYQHWIDQGYAGDMHYLHRPDALAKRGDPRLILPSVKTVIVAAASYAQPDQIIDLPPMHGRVAMYAWGEDYHDWLKRRMQHMIRLLETESGSSIDANVYVDTGPIMERPWAILGGLGWIGKNACLIHPRLGSYLFLAVALVDVAVEAVRDQKLPSCGNCTRCLDACPTGALVAPGVVDARRCLSYLTIENRGSIPETLRPAVGSSVFGCDVCQQVCPWNADAEPGRQSVPIESRSLYLPDILRLDQDEFRSRFRQSPIWRATADGLVRNAAIALGNKKDPLAFPYLQRLARTSLSAMVVEHTHWAIEQLV